MTNQNSRRRLTFACAALGALFAVQLVEAGMTVNHIRNRERARINRLVYIESSSSKWEGYLDVKEPVPLRFSDDEATRKRPPSPALPEFSMLSQEVIPYLIDKPLPDDQLRARELLSEVAIELEPYVTISGIIDQKSTVLKLPTVTIDEEGNRPAALRPEEVLIFFETSNNAGGRTGAVIPFSTTNPVPTIRSSAEYNKQ